ncbi:MAG: Uma2 family endonuclease [Hyphomicrobium sp.]
MNTAQLSLPPMMTVADFIDWPGDGTSTRYELVDGVLRAMAPGSDTHNTIVSNLTGLIWQHLKQSKSSCRVVGALGVQPRVRAEWNFRIPDLGVTCSPNKAGEIMTPNPILLIEVLSPGNANDTYENVRAYATLPSVREIMIVHSTRMKAELLRRNENGDWPADPADIETGGTVHLESIGAEFAIAEIYAGTHLLSDPN